MRDCLGLTVVGIASLKVGSTIPWFGPRLLCLRKQAEQGLQATLLSALECDQCQASALTFLQRHCGLEPRMKMSPLPLRTLCQHT